MSMEENINISEKIDRYVLGQMSEEEKEKNQKKNAFLCWQKYLLRTCAGFDCFYDGVDAVGQDF